jgi:tRNA 2-thiocytidine biosynthesis protein TtcA
MHTYAMLADGDRVLVAVSGGVDSLVLTWLLYHWQQKAPIAYDLVPFHIDMEPDDDKESSSACAVRKQLDLLAIPLDTVPTAWPQPQLASPDESTKKICYTCASRRRKQLFEHARRKKCNKIALGHHQDDIIETFFLNLCFAGNISTMVPRQDLFGGRLALIRPLSFLTKDDIYLIAERLRIRPVPSPCPLSEQTKRKDIRHFLDEMYTTMPEARAHIFAALANVRRDYLLKPAPKPPVGGGKGGHLQ